MFSRVPCMDSSNLWSWRTLVAACLLALSVLEFPFFCCESAIAT